jgi:PmbA protein
MGDLDATTAIAMARTAEDAARGFDARITNSDGATVSRTAGSVGLVLSGGFRGGYQGSYASVHVVPLANDVGGKKRRGSYYSAKRFLTELEDPAGVGAEAARRTLRKLGARKVPTCEAQVVFDPEAARSIVGAFAGCAMGGAIWRKSSYLVGREGTEVASPLITLVDNPHLPRAPGSRPFDGEGLLGRRTASSIAGSSRHTCATRTAPGSSGDRRPPARRAGAAEGWGRRLRTSSARGEISPTSRS